MRPPLRVALNLNNRAVVRQVGTKFTGKAPDLARALGLALGREVQLVGYPDAGAVVADVQDGWDLACLGADPARAHLMQFSTPYYHVRATFLLRSDRPEADCAAVLAGDASILSAGRAAYHGRLRELAGKGRLIPCDTAQNAVTAFQEGHASVLSGLREGLNDLRLTGTRILPDDFATIPQAVAIPLHNAALYAKVEKAIQAFLARTKT
ncbi:MAG: transporter substrate-binding domain-containing protein [Pseudomonadota bacterium]|nr:transporter substrate-binding domain-containing protein [Pseudomonadota bacterium]